MQPADKMKFGLVRRAVKHTALLLFALLFFLSLGQDARAKSALWKFGDQLKGREKELYDLKHELISTQIKLESAQEQVKELQQNRSDDAKQIVRLETELKKK